MPTLMIKDYKESALFSIKIYQIGKGSQQKFKGGNVWVIRDDLRSGNHVILLDAEIEDPESSSGPGSA
jgi:hypothetical protein